MSVYMVASVSFLHSLEKELEHLSFRIEFLKTQIGQLPAGRLKRKRRGKAVRYCQCLDKQDHYLSKQKWGTVEALAKKRYYQAQLQDLQKEMDVLNRCMAVLSEPKETQILLEERPYLVDLLKSVFQPVDEQLREWAEADYPSTAGHPENLIHQGPKGVMYRSKSETMIARGLFEKRIPFRYENDKDIGGVTYHIDFTIRHPKTGQYIYWEHAGAMDMESYAVNMGMKLRAFASVGIVLGRNLILTMETRQYPLSYGMVEDIIQQWFGDND